MHLLQLLQCGCVPPQPAVPTVDELEALGPVSDTPGTDWQLYGASGQSGPFQPGPLPGQKLDGPSPPTPPDLPFLHRAVPGEVHNAANTGRPSGVTNSAVPILAGPGLQHQLDPGPLASGQAETAFATGDTQSPSLSVAGGAPGTLVAKRARLPAPMTSAVVCQPGEMPPTMASHSRAQQVPGAQFEIGQRVIIDYTPASGLEPVLVRGRVTDVMLDLAGFPVYSVQVDHGSGLIVNDIPEELLADEGPQTILATGTSISSFQASAEASTVTIQPGDTGQIVVEGFGLGLLASLPLIRDLWSSNLIPNGLVVAGITSEGLNRFVVNWEVPNVAVTAQAQSQQAVMGIAVTVVVIGAVIIAILLVAGWLISRVELALNGRPGKPPLAITPASFPDGLVPEIVNDQPVIVVDKRGNYLAPGTPIPADGAIVLGTPGSRGISQPFGTGWLIAGALLLFGLTLTQRR